MCTHMHQSFLMHSKTFFQLVDHTWLLFHVYDRSASLINSERTVYCICVSSIWLFFFKSALNDEVTFWRGRQAEHKTIGTRQNWSTCYFCFISLMACFFPKSIITHKKFFSICKRWRRERAESALYLEDSFLVCLSSPCEIKYKLIWWTLFIISNF